MEQKFFCSFMKKGLFFIFFSISFVTLVNGMVRINEVELNPSGEDSGNEWIELYSQDEADLKGWKLINNDGDEFYLNESFSGYLIINFEKQWLDNKDEKIILYNGENLIDETILIDDSKNNELTWNFCGEWKFIDSTKNKKNSCSEKEQEKLDDNYSKDNKSEEAAEEAQVVEKEDGEDVNVGIEDEGKDDISQTSSSINNVIKLTPKINKYRKIYKSRNWYIKQYAVYFYAAFITILLIVIILKRK